MNKKPETDAPLPLAAAVRLAAHKILNPDSLTRYGGIKNDSTVLVVLAAGAGTRFGPDPKCIQPVHGKPLARHLIDAFRTFSPSPVLAIVGYRGDDVAAAIGSDNICVRSDNPTGGTAYAALEALSVKALTENNPLLIIAMGDRIIPAAIFQRLCTTHLSGPTEADLTFLTAVYEPPRNNGKGRILRDADSRVLRIIEQSDIDLQQDVLRRQMSSLTEGNCPLYAIRAAALAEHLKPLTNANAQKQYYLTDLVESISRAGGDIRTITTNPHDTEYQLLCSDVTRPADLAVIESILTSQPGLHGVDHDDVRAAVEAIKTDRPAGQIASIARQLEELLAEVRDNRLCFDPDRPVAIGISGGRLRIAFMHPDMVRFFGPAWQMPIGAGDAHGTEQIVMLAQTTDDRQIHLFPMNPEFRKTGNSISADNPGMYPGPEVCDLHTYEQFGTAMSENLLRSLGYFSDGQLEQLRRDGSPLPPSARWISSNMRHPFPLVGNAIASMRTLRKGQLGSKVRHSLGPDAFKGMSMVLTGNIPQGGFSSSSAVTVATLNAVNALFALAVPPDVLVDLACQAEYGTGVRAGSLDQATEQKGKARQGALISSNPKDGYRILGTYNVPTDRFQIIFPYSVDRDRDAWRWSWGAYAQSAADGPLTTGEMRKMTGKAAELAALLTQLPLDTDFFKQIEPDLLSKGALSRDSRRWIASVLLKLPLLIPLDELRSLIKTHRAWYVDQLRRTARLDAASAARKANIVLASLLKGWRQPLLRRTPPDLRIITERGVPLRAMTAYLFAEVAKNFHLIHHTHQWIEYVSRSQLGDRCVDIPLDALPPRDAMQTRLDFEHDLAGPDLLDAWLRNCRATPFDYNRGLDDAALSAAEPPDFAALHGSNFFRGLALIDLAEAMLKRAFGPEAVAVRINAAGQGDYWQVHIDTQKADPNQVKDFIRTAFYRRFSIAPDPQFVQLHSGGGALGVRLDTYASLPRLINRLGT